MRSIATLPHLAYSGAPPVAYVADSDAGRARCVAAIDAVGARGLADGDWSAALEAEEEASCPHPLLLDVTTDLGAELDRRLDMARRTAETVPVIIHVARAMIDPVMARADHPNIDILCEASAAERTAALGIAVTRRDPVLREEGEDSGPHLRKLSEEVGRIARMLAQLSTEPAGPSLTIQLERPADQDYHLPPASAVRAIIRLRRLREQFFASELFADPAWDMLLDLLLARVERRPVAVSSLCIAASVPPTTALRWIKKLTDDGIFVRTADPHDGRRVFIDLSESAAGGMAAYVRAVQRLGIVLP